MSSKEFEGRSIEEAVDAAASALGVEPSSLEYSVVDEGTSGLFGLGSKPAKIRLAGDGDEAAAEPRESRPRERVPGIVGPAPEKAKQAQEIAEGIIQRMGVQAKVSVRDEEREIIVVLEEVEGSTDVVDVLCRHRPSAVPSFQFLLNKVVNRFPDNRKHILVEAPEAPRGARSTPRRSASDEPEVVPDPNLDPEMVALGQLLAEKAKTLNKVITVHPMHAADRRAIHHTVTVIDGVKTRSSGDGLYRRMHIVPDSLDNRSGKRRRRGGRRRGGGPREGAPSPEANV